MPKCIEFFQIIKIIATLSYIGSFSVMAIEYDDMTLMHKLNPYTKIRTRGPNSHIPSSDTTIVPQHVDSWMNEILVEDNSGVLVSVRSNLKSWEETQEYAENWNLESTGLYKVPTVEEKKRYLDRHLLKYIDKRLSGEIKNAEEGSTLKKVGNVQKALKPKAEAQISERIKLKFKARVLQGKAIIRVENPWVECNSEVNIKGHMQVNLRREVAALKLDTRVQYTVNDGNWIATIDRPLNERLLARISSSQADDEPMFSNRSDRKLELLYNIPW